ncbi:MAG TPA: ABC transporter permease [Acidimicrobiales bacterium]|nr:ABC transporter permease [Acidimicrobiales bacterium]
MAIFHEDKAAAGAAVAAVVAPIVEPVLDPDTALGQAALADGDRPVLTQWQLFRRRFFRHRLAVVAGTILLLLYLMAILAPVIAPYPLNPPLTAKVLLAARHGPSLAHPLGTDELGRDQLTRIMYAGRISLLIGLSVALVSTAVGVTLGSVAGWLGGRVDQLIMRLTDLFLIIPGLAILMIAQRGFGSSTLVIILIVSVLYWQWIARVVRGMILSLREKEFIEAARASGASNWRIITRHLLPNTIGPIVVNTTLVVGYAILTESTLSFLGFGIQPPSVSWGNMLAQSEGSVGTPTAYLVYFPGLFILLTVLAVNFLGDGLRDAFDPQSRR